MNQSMRILFAGFLGLCVPAMQGQQVSPEDKKFIEKAAQGGMHEVQFAKMGLERGSSEAIKSFSQRLVNDHTKANKELMALAKRKGVSLMDTGSGAHGGGHGATSPGSPSSGNSSESASIAKGGSQTSTGAGRQASSPESDSRNRTTTSDHSSSSFPGAEQLTSKSGKDFDEEFVRMAIADHKKDVAEFEMAASSASDSELKAFAAKTLPTLRAHLKEAESLQKK